MVQSLINQLACGLEDYASEGEEEKNERRKGIIDSQELLSFFQAPFI